MGEEFLAALLSLSLSGACLMGLAEVLARLLRGRIPPGVRRLMWLLVLFRLLCPWSISGGLLDRGTAELCQAAAPEHSTQALEEVPTHTAPSYEILEHEETGRQIDLAAGLTALWAAGFLTAMARRGVAYGRMCRELRRTLRPAGPGERAVFARLTQGENRPPALRVSPAAPTPMLVGLLRPQLILPELELSQEELEGVFSHELTHWRHRDLWIKWLAALAVCVHWFNPAARLLAERLDRDCELYCDQTVARDWDRPRRARYGELLLRPIHRPVFPETAIRGALDRDDEWKKLWKEGVCAGRSRLPDLGAGHHRPGGLHRPSRGGAPGQLDRGVSAGDHAHRSLLAG